MEFFVQILFYVVSNAPPEVCVCVCVHAGTEGWRSAHLGSWATWVILRSLPMVIGRREGGGRRRWWWRDWWLGWDQPSLVQQWGSQRTNKCILFQRQMFTSWIIKGVFNTWSTTLIFSRHYPEEPYVYCKYKSQLAGHLIDSTLPAPKCKVRLMFDWAFVWILSLSMRIHSKWV